MCGRRTWSRKLPSMANASIELGIAGGTLLSRRSRRLLFPVFTIKPSVLHLVNGTVVSGYERTCSKSNFLWQARTTKRPIRSRAQTSDAIRLSEAFLLTLPFSLKVASFSLLMGRPNWVGSFWQTLTNSLCFFCPLSCTDSKNVWIGSAAVLPVLILNSFLGAASIWKGLHDLWICLITFWRSLVSLLMRASRSSAVVSSFWCNPAISCAFETIAVLADFVNIQRSREL